MAQTSFHIIYTAARLADTDTGRRGILTGERRALAARRLERAPPASMGWLAIPATPCPVVMGLLDRPAPPDQCFNNSTNARRTTNTKTSGADDSGGTGGLAQGGNPPCLPEHPRVAHPIDAARVAPPHLDPGADFRRAGDGRGGDRRGVARCAAADSQALSGPCDPAAT